MSLPRHNLAAKRRRSLLHITRNPRDIEETFDVIGAMQLRRGVPDLFRAFGPQINLLGPARFPVHETDSASSEMS
jgi:hypothetical protein